MLRKKDKISFIIILILIVIINKGFKFIYWPIELGNITIGLVSCVLAIIWFLCRINKKGANFSSIVLFFTFFPFFSIINSVSIGESFSSCLARSFTYSFLWVTYFLLHYFEIRERTILNVFGFIGLFIFVVQIVQQFTYPNVFFGVLPDETSIGGLIYVEIRNGILRFRNEADYGVIYAFALLLFLKGKYTTKNFVFFLILAVSVYLTLTRQIILSFMLVVLFSQLKYIQKKLIKTLFILFLSVVVLWYYYDSLFGAFLERTEYEVNEVNDKYVRILAASYLWNDYWKSFSTFLFGYGFPSLYETKLGKNFAYYVVDVGFIGAMWKYGIMYVSLCFYVLYSLCIKLKNKVPKYVKFYVFYVIIVIVMIFPMGVNPAKTIIWPFLLYICDLHINKSPLALKTI